MKKPWLHYAALVLVILAGAGTRWYDLGGKSLWTDELITLSVAQEPLGEWKRIMPLDIPPGHVLAVKLCWMVRDTDFSVRVPSAVSGTLGFLFIYLLLRAAHSASWGLAAASLLVISTSHLYHAQDARMYAHLFLLTTVATWCLLGLHFGRGSPWRWWVGYGAAVAAGVYDTYMMLFLLPVHGVLVSSWVLRKHKDEGPLRVRCRPLFCWLACMAWVVFALSFWHESLFELLNQQTGTSEAEPTTSLGWMPFRMVMTYLAFSEATWQVEWMVVLVGLGALCRRDRMLGLFAASWILIPFLLLFALQTNRVLIPRYFLFLLPLYLWLMIEGMAAVLSMLRKGAERMPVPARARRAVRFLVPALAAAAFVGCLTGCSLKHMAAYYGKEKMNWRDATAYLFERVEEGDMIICGIHYASEGVKRYRPSHVHTQVKLVDTLQGLTALERDLPSHPKGVWYISGGWDMIPEWFRQKFLLSNMEEVRTFPAQDTYGEIHILHREPLF